MMNSYSLFFIFYHVHLTCQIRDSIVFHYVSHRYFSRTSPTLILCSHLNICVIVELMGWVGMQILYIICHKLYRKSKWSKQTNKQKKLHKRRMHIWSEVTSNNMNWWKWMDLLFFCYHNQIRQARKGIYITNQRGHVCI